MISKLYAAWLACIAIYEKQDAFDKIINVGCDVIGIKEVNNTLTITPLGTIDKAMWESNCQIETIDHLIFGPVHAGFLSSAEAIYTEIKPIIVQAILNGSAISIQGHSRGAALAVDLTALLILDGVKVDQLIALESPKPGCQQFTNWLAIQIGNGNIKDYVSTVNLLDPVPDVPELVYPHYTRPLPTIDLHIKPGGLEDLNPAAYHSAALIYQGFPVLSP